MRNTGYFKNKQIIIVGLSRSGFACAELLCELGAQVSITDNQDNAQVRLNAAKLKTKGVKIELGRHSQDFIKGRDLVIISPGVTDKASPVAWAKIFSIPVISEIEFAWILCDATVIAVTGSNGKTTVTTLIGKVLESQGKKAHVCGNIGIPFSQELEKISTDDYVVLEVSSFQLEKIDKFKPKVSVILNFSRNHLDRHKDMQEYLEAKKRIFMNQDSSDYLVLNQKDPVIKGLAREARARVIYFSATEEFNSNQEAVLAVTSILGVGKESCLNVFRDFKGIEHRLEYVAEINGIRFINDSKATTADSAIWALENIRQPIVLIAGGRDKGIDYGIILDLARKKLRRAVLIGEAKEKIMNTLVGIPAEGADTLEEAVKLAFQRAEPGDCVLLSPMCSSFDMFSDYEERGRVFKGIVGGLARQCA